jgi:segregation and condensation protein B
MSQEIKNIIESLLFVSETPLTMDHLKGILEGEETGAIRAAMDALIAEYEERDGGFVLKQVAGGYQFRTQGRYNEWIKRLIRPNAPRLSKAALESLAIIAYNQPIIRSDIEHIRGVDSGGCAPHADGAKADPRAGAQGDPRTSIDLCHHQAFSGGI